jgi:hypothetical protein
MKLVVCLLAGVCLNQVDGAADPFGADDPVTHAAASPAATPDSAAAPAEAPADAVPAEATQEAPAAEDPVEQVEIPRPRSAAPEILAAAIKQTVETHDGEPLTLLAAFERGAGQPKQRIARAYWKLALAMAADQFATAERQDFANEAAWTPANNTRTPEDAALLATAVATSAARANEARLMLTAAQLELADAIGHAEPKLPLATDRPHVGAYRTKYERIFGAGQAPARLRQINRTIPYRAAGIDRRADSVRSAEEAWDSSLAALGRGQADLDSTLASHEALVRERRQFLDAVRDYNFDIAEYALAVGGEHLNEPTIVSMLIQPAPTVSNEPAPSEPPATFVPGGESAGKAAPTDTASTAEAKAQQTLRPLAPGDAAQAADATATQFQDIAGEAGPKLTQLVGERLTTEPATTADAAESLGLAAFLTRATTVERPLALAAYWRLAEQTARRQVFLRQLAVLRGLQAAETLPDDPAGKARLASEIVSVEADLAESALQCEAAQAEAARVLARTTADKPLHLTSLPHAGRYPARLNAQPSTPTAGRQLRRAATLIDALHPALMGHAAALVATEQARAVEAQAAGRGTGELETVIDAARQERLKSLAMLQRLTDYNLAIGDYVAAVLPANTPADQLARSLVLSP